MIKADMEKLKAEPYKYNFFKIQDTYIRILQDDLIIKVNSEGFVNVEEVRDSECGVHYSSYFIEDIIDLYNMGLFFKIEKD